MEKAADEKTVEYYSSDIDWEELRKVYEPIINKPEEPKTEKKDVKFDSSAWEEFYRNNQDGFFKNRNYLQVVLEEVAKTCANNQDKVFRLIECGCGAGNSLYPLKNATLSNLHLYGFDVSKTAVELVKKHEEFDSKRMNAWELDATKTDLKTIVETESINFCTMIFFLNAIPPELMLPTLENVRSVMQKGGLLYFRDHGLYDLAMIRNHTKGNKVGENLYMKGDGINSYFFSKEKAVELFEKAGFECIECDYCTVSRENKKRNIRLDRVFVSAKFIKK